MIWNHPVETTILIPGCFMVQRTIMIFTSFQKSTSNKEDSLMLPVLLFSRRKIATGKSTAKQKKNKRTDKPHRFWKFAQTIARY